MAFTIIFQRTKNCDSVKTFFLTTPEQTRGLAWDGTSLWLCNSNLTQVDLPSLAVTRTVTIAPAGAYDALTFDGENFWGPISGNAGIGQVTRNGERMNFVGSLFSTSPTGIAHDGHLLWVLYVNPLSGFFDISMVDTITAGIGKTFSTGLAAGTAAGLVFDGEYLVTRDVLVTTQRLQYFSREGFLVKTQAEGAAGGSAGISGLAFDGEYFYTGQTFG